MGFYVYIGFLFSLSANPTLATWPMANSAIFDEETCAEL
jgi:hypothetical protein